MALAAADIISAVFDIVGVALLAALLYYALAILFLMRKGKLEKSWQYMSMSVIILTVGVILFALSATVSSSLTLPFMWSASFVMIIGTFLLLLGFKFHYRFWSGRELQTEKKNSIEP